MAQTSNDDLQVDIGRKIFLEFDQELLIRKFHLEADPDYIYLTYLNTPCRICRGTGRIDELRDGTWQECREFGTVMTVYDLLCHHQGPVAPALYGAWCTVGTFVVTGVTSTGGFTNKYAARFDRDPEALKQACLALGGRILPSMAGADLTCRFQVTPYFPVLMQFWHSDEEFPAQVVLLWDRNSMAFLHFETTFYLQGDLLGRLLQIFPR